MGSRPIFWKALKFAIYLYFCRLGRIIFSRLIKIKRNIGKSRKIFFGCEIGYHWEVDSLSKMPCNYVCINFLSNCKLPIYSYYCQLDPIIWSRLNKIKKCIGKSEICFIQLWGWISIWSRPIFGMALKFAIYPYCRFGRIILSLLIKIKKYIEKSKIIFFCCGIGYHWEVDPFSKMAWNYVSIHIFVGLIV